MTTWRRNWWKYGRAERKGRGYRTAWVRFGGSAGLSAAPPGQQAHLALRSLSTCCWLRAAAHGQRERVRQRPPQVALRGAVAATALPGAGQCPGRAATPSWAGTGLLRGVPALGWTRSAQATGHGSHATRRQLCSTDPCTGRTKVGEVRPRHTLLPAVHHQPSVNVPRNTSTRRIGCLLLAHAGHPRELLGVQVAEHVGLSQVPGPGHVTSPARSLRPLRPA